MEDRNIIEQYRKKYIKRMRKRITGKPQPVRLIMERTFNSAMKVLERIDGIPFEQLTMDVYFFCKDVEFKEIVRLYDAQLELAGANADRFVFGLHAFYNDVVSTIKKQAKEREFAVFLGTVARLQTEKREQLNAGVVDAYLDLILQTFEYLRPSKFALDECVYGVSTEGEFLTGPYPYPYSDLPALELEDLVERGWKPKNRDEMMDTVTRLYAKQGIEVHSEFDLEKLEMIQRIHITSTSALLPFINEYTFQIVPERTYESADAPLTRMRAAVDADDLVDRLRHRRRTLPANGVQFELDDSTGELKGALLQEILYDDSVHCLYRLDTENGSLAGYYNTTTGYLYSVTRDANSPIPFKNMRSLILTLYASQVLDSIHLTDHLIWQGDCPVDIRVYQKGGRLNDTYHRSANKEKDLSLYGHKEKAIAGFIRRLPEGATASAEAVEMARAYGFELADNETYVRPFMKQVFVRKNN